MNIGKLYGIGIGPGDPDLMTFKGVKILGDCQHVFVPKARQDGESLALNIARKHIHPGAKIHEILFPMTTDKKELEERWAESARQIAGVLETGSDACFLTLGDAFLYSTYIYMLRALRRRLPDADVITIPGITAFSAAAAVSEFPVGEAKEPVTIVPTAEDLDAVRRAIKSGGTVVLMKIGKRLDRVLEVLDNEGATDRSVFVSHVGLDNQKIVKDLNTLRGGEADRGYLSVILVRSRYEGDS
ncbi:MAG: precorrin-2 C(20)-methyltransferase [Desulfomonilaceae bacterium]